MAIKEILLYTPVVAISDQQGAVVSGHLYAIIFPDDLADNQATGEDDNKQ